MGKTITTYSIDGNPKGTQYASISNKICQMFIIPRSNLPILNEQTDLQTPAFYILWGENEVAKPPKYIGETKKFRGRVNKHDSKKNWGQRTLIFTSQKAAITKADVQYWKYRVLANAKQANIFILNENKQTPNEPNLPEYQKDNMDAFFENIKFLTPFISYNMFEITQTKIKNIFYTKGKECDAKGYYNSSGFHLLKRSVIAQKYTPIFSFGKKRNKLVQEYVSYRNYILTLTSD